MPALILQDGTIFRGEAFGKIGDTDGEVVFNTGMAGYVSSLTDPSYRGQILVFTYPLIGNYGVPSEEKNAWGFAKNLESERIQVRALVVGQVSEDYSHQAAVSSLSKWMEHHGIPGITGIDTRALTKKLRETGVMLGRIRQELKEVKESPSFAKATDGRKESKEIPDPNVLNLVAEVSCGEVKTYEPEGDVRASVVAYDCGIKNNILRSFLKRGVRVHRVPWDFDLSRCDLPFDGVFISNGPGDPKMCKATIAQIRFSIEKNIPTFGICLGNQLMALAIGGDTYKLKYGHRGVNQPCIRHDERGKKTERCIITSQNHGFAVREDKLPKGWTVWYSNANDGTNEGIRHESGRFMSVQFHPEATPGPEDANFLFDEFVEMIGK